MASFWTVFDERYAGAGLLHRRCNLAAVVDRVAGGLVYVATPDVFERPAMAQVSRVARVVSLLAANRITAVSPYLMQSQLMAAGWIEGDAGFWQAWASPILGEARAVVVPDVDGADQSLTVAATVGLALKRNIQVFHLEDI